jgi:hypothetical protein
MTEGNGEVRKLPKGWLLTKLGQVCEVVNIFQVIFRL